jgi:quercetin dioxygenase-like cupin family protein
MNKLEKETAEVTRSKVFELEAAMKRECELVELPVKHYFSQGVYARELFIPKGTVLTGKIHKYEQLNIMSQGELSVLTENGIKRVKAPFTIVSPPGTKRVAYAHEDTIWTTIHGTEETDVEKIEEKFIAQSEEDYLEYCKTLQIEGEVKCPG